MIGACWTAYCGKEKTHDTFLATRLVFLHTGATILAHARMGKASPFLR